MESKLLFGSNLEPPNHRPSHLFLVFLGSYAAETPSVFAPESRDLSVRHGMAKTLDATLISSTHSTLGSKPDLSELVELMIASALILWFKAY